MKKYRVAMYGKGDQQVAEAYVAAENFPDAHARALALFRLQLPDLDPEEYDQTIAEEILYRGASQP